ncbi:MAG: FkbM family methyltransferase [Deltaproteobacteria bacterium]
MKHSFLRLFPPALLQIVKKRYYTGKLRTAGCGEPEMDVIRRLVLPGDTVIDIGANYGVYSLFLSGLVGAQGRVHAIEAVPWTCDILEYAARKLGRENIEVVRCAASDRDGSVAVEVPRDETGGENYYRAQVRSSDTGPGSGKNRRFRVSARTLDSLFPAYGGRLGFIKCDTEGHELNCIRGGLDLIRRSKPALMIELGYDPLKVPCEQELLELLRREGYGVYKLHGGLLEKDYYGRKEGINYFFLQPQQALMAGAIEQPTSVV